VNPFVPPAACSVFVHGLFYSSVSRYSPMDLMEPSWTEKLSSMNFVCTSWHDIVYGLQLKHLEIVVHRIFNISLNVKYWKYMEGRPQQQWRAASGDTLYIFLHLFKCILRNFNVWHSQGHHLTSKLVQIDLSLQVLQFEWSYAYVLNNFEISFLKIYLMTS